MSLAHQLTHLKNLKKLFFHTPLLEIQVEIKGKLKKIYAKYEAFNFSGSIKDRMAYYIYEHAYKSELLKPEQSVIEVTSGNTGIAIAALGKFLDHEVTLVMPDWLSKERYLIIELIGANIIKISKEEGGFIGSLELAKKIAMKKNMYYPDQFSNEYNKKAHEKTTAPELVMQLKKLGLKPDRFVAGVGTGGTVMGFHDFFEKEVIDCKCHPLEPANSPVLSSGGKHIGSHRIQGISDEFIPALVKLDKLNNIISVDDSESIALARQINKMGLSVGISSGANLLGALQLLIKYPDEIITTVFSDSSFKYLSTDLCKKASDSVSLAHYPFKIIDYKAY
ncbi:MAG: Cysteine synthase [Candidatus Anoxychlamydiales bacterium]|nr:Cysteine synthase [Candidatus Anoxychlamydiales bacterium]HEU64248.1 PLP-dependent cysteine synthase family protein [Chlamydiota bacterium]